MKLKKFLCVSASLWLIFLLSGCRSTPQNQNRVVLYCSVDDVYARPIVAELEKKTGLQIDVLYDVEAAKTAGLANRIRAEKNRPRGDVFWSSALLQTLLLQREGLLQEYLSPSAKDIPVQYKDKKGAWTGMGLRARVIMSNAKLPAQKSNGVSSQDLLNPFFKNKIGISNPQFGTASDWVASLTVRWGKEKTLNYFRALKKNGVRVLPGNGVVAEKVAHGELMAGVTDSDDYVTFSKKLVGGKKSIARANGFEDGVYTMKIPGSVAILKTAPHLENAQKLVDAIVSLEIEELLVKQMPGVLPTRRFPLDGEQKYDAEFLFVPDSENLTDTAKWADAWLSIREPLAEILLTP